MLRPLPEMEQRAPPPVGSSAILFRANLPLPRRCDRPPPTRVPSAHDETRNHSRLLCDGFLGARQAQCSHSVWPRRSFLSSLLMTGTGVGACAMKMQPQLGPLARPVSRPQTLATAGATEGTMAPGPAGATRTGAGTAANSAVCPRRLPPAATQPRRWAQKRTQMHLQVRKPERKKRRKEELGAVAHAR
jgi:hypothetical protein